MLSRTCKDTSPLTEAADAMVDLVADSLNR